MTTTPDPHRDDHTSATAALLDALARSTRDEPDAGFESRILDAVGRVPPRARPSGLRRRRMLIGAGSLAAVLLAAVVVRSPGPQRTGSVASGLGEDLAGSAVLGASFDVLDDTLSFEDDLHALSESLESFEDDTFDADEWLPQESLL
jgi:hypothetical protein